MITEKSRYLENQGIDAEVNPKIWLNFTYCIKVIINIFFV